ncbi:MAG: cytochrome c oxidase subunit 3 [Acidimicrobiales bacterium]
MTAATTGLPSAEVTRPRTVLVGTMFASAAAFMAFVGVVLVYVHERAEAVGSDSEWFPEGAVQLGPAGFVLSTLILSIFTIQWALQAITNDDRKNALVALALSSLFGAAVFNQLWFIINDTGFTLSATNAQFMFFVVLGTFTAFMISAVVFVALTFLRALIGQFGPRKADSVAAAAFYWNTVVAMYAIAWYVIFVTK